MCKMNECDINVKKYKKENNQCCGTHRFLDSCWPAFIQHRPSLCVVDLEPQWEANWTDVICCVLRRRQTQVSPMKWSHSLCTGVWMMLQCQTRVWGMHRHSRRHGRAVCGRQFVLCEPGLPAGSVDGSCRQTAPALTTSCRPTWLTPTDLRRPQAAGTDGERWKIPILIIWEPSQFTTLAVIVKRIREKTVSLWSMKK